MYMIRFRGGGRTYLVGDLRRAATKVGVPASAIVSAESFTDKDQSDYTLVYVSNSLPRGQVYRLAGSVIDSATGRHPLVIG